MINYILGNEKWFKEYVLNYTNASFIVGTDFYFKDGLFSGYDAKARKYNKDTWVFEKDGKGIPKRDMTLTNPRCVFQIMKKHYSRYTLEKVSSITGVSKEDLTKVYAAYSATGVKDKAGTECYALGWTHHTTGSQIIRTMSIIQLLLGNMGICGGGVNALRGEPNVQGSTDHAILYNILPGYLKMPAASQDTLAKYIEKNTPKIHRSPIGQLLSELPEVHGQFSQGPLWGQGNRRERLRLFMASQARRRKGDLPDAPLRQDVRGQDQGPLRRRHRPGGQLPQHDQGPQGPREPRLARRREHLRQRDLLLLEGPRCRPRKGQDGGLPPSRLGLHGKGGQPEQQRPVGPVEVQGRRGPRRRDPRRGDHDQDPRCRQGPSMPRKGASSRSPS